MNTYLRVGYSAVTAGTGSVTVKLGPGDWEITSISVIMGSQIASVNGMEVGEGHVAFERLAGDAVTVEQTHHLVSGRCTRTHPLVMHVSKIVNGPGQIKSYINHGGGSTFDHTMAVIYKRRREEP